MILARPYVGVLLWSWIGYMNPHRLGWGFAYNFPFAMLIGLVTIIGILFSKDPKRLPKDRIVYLLVIFNIWILITTALALDSAYAWVDWDKVVKVQLITFITLMLINSRERIHLLVTVIALSLAFYGVKGGIFTVLTGGQFHVVGPEGSFISGNTEIALALVMTLPLLRYLQLSFEKKWMQWAMLGAALLSMVAIVGSYSRGAFLAAAAMIFVLWYKSKQKLLIGGMMFLGVIVMFAFMPDKWSDRMGTIETFEEDKSAMGRINAWYFAFNLAKDRPLIGGGFGAFDRRYFKIYAPEPDNFHDAHSIYFEILGEQGFVGLGLFLLIIFLTWRTGNHIMRITKGNDELKWANDLAMMVQVSLAGYIVGGAFLGLAYFDLLYHLIAIMVLTKMVVLKHLEEHGGTTLQEPPVIQRPPSGRRQRLP